MPENKALIPASSLVHRRCLLMACFVALVVYPVQCQVLKGITRRCHKEGDEVEIPLITHNPCISCYCENGSIVCDREACTTNLPCLEEEQTLRGCCRRCSGRLQRRCFGEEGNAIEHSRTWKKRGDPCLECTCVDGKISCVRRSCPESPPRCGKGRVSEQPHDLCCPVCAPAPGVCTVFGDPHYRSFDGRAFGFHGNCAYVLTQDCSRSRFSVAVRSRAIRGRSWTDSVQLMFLHPGHEESLVSLEQGRVVIIDGTKVHLPYISSQLVMWEENKLVKVASLSGVGLSWDGKAFLEVTVPPRYKGILCGLCGNFNGFPRDDVIGSGGMFEPTARGFARSWVVGDCFKDPPYPRLRTSNTIKSN